MLLAVLCIFLKKYVSCLFFFFFFKQKTAYEMTCDWSSDVCSSDLTQLLDVLFVFLLIPGVESFSGGSGYGQGVINAHYTHSLAGALLIALAAGAGAWKLWGRQGGLIIAATVFSHWLLDLVVHRPDLPLLPGSAGSFHRPKPSSGKLPALPGRDR